jgi:hypothetical protein
VSHARLYPHAFIDLQDGVLDWTAMSIRAMLMDDTFAYDATKIFRDELDDAKVIATSDVMTNPVRNGNVVTGDPIQWLQVESERVVRQIVLYDDTGDDAYSHLIAWFGTDAVDGLPYTINGQNYYLYPVQPPGGFFSYGLYEDILGAIGSYPPAYYLPLGETVGGTNYAIPVLVFGLDLAVNERICLLPDELDRDECGPPTIRSSLCE